MNAWSWYLVSLQCYSVAQETVSLSSSITNRVKLSSRDFKSRAAQKEQATSRFTKKGANNWQNFRLVTFWPVWSRLPTTKPADDSCWDDEKMQCVDIGWVAMEIRLCVCETSVWSLPTVNTSQELLWRDEMGAVLLLSTTVTLLPSTTRALDDCVSIKVTSDWLYPNVQSLLAINCRSKVTFPSPILVGMSAVSKAARIARDVVTSKFIESTKTLATLFP